MNPTLFCSSSHSSSRSMRTKASYSDFQFQVSQWASKHTTNVWSMLNSMLILLHILASLTCTIKKLFHSNHTFLFFFPKPSQYIFSDLQRSCNPGFKLWMTTYQCWMLNKVTCKWFVVSKNKKQILLASQTN